mgnify:CR=1 FL=1
MDFRKRNLTKFGYWVAAVFFIWFLLPCPVDLFLLMSGALKLYLERRSLFGFSACLY